MQSCGRIHALWMSFYSPDIYREAARSWAGIGIVYLILLLSLAWLPTPIRWFLQLRDFAATTAPAIVSQLPAITIRNGVMSGRPAGRHVIRDPESPNDGIFIVDDSIDALSSDAVDVDTIVLTRHELGMIRRSTGERRIWKLTPAADMELTPGDVGAFLTSLQYWIPFVGYIGCLIGSLVVRTLQILVYGWIGQGMARNWRIDLDYPSLLRIAAIAVTPVVVLRTIIGPWEPAWYLRWPVAVAITVVYLSFGIRASGGHKEHGEFSH
jgi:hypothetical protein